MLFGQGLVEGKCSAGLKRSGGLWKLTEIVVWLGFRYLDMLQI